VWRACADRAWESVQRGGPSAGAGPLQMAIRQAPVCIVHGAGEGQAEAALSLAQKLYFVSRYAVPILNARTDEEAGPEAARCSKANLILIGDPGTNLWTSTHRCAFSYVSFFRSRATGAPSAAFGLDGKKFASPGTGLVALGPLGGGRLGLLVHGTDAQGLAKAIQRVPSSSGMVGSDYIVDGPAAGWMGDGGVLAAGYLDALWRPGPTRWAEPDAEAPDVLGLAEVGGAAELCGDRLRLLRRSDEERSAPAEERQGHGHGHGHGHGPGHGHGDDDDDDVDDDDDSHNQSGSHSQIHGHGARAAPAALVLLSLHAAWAVAA